MVEPRVTLVQVAARAGVSKTTAGYVLTGQDAQMRIAEDTRHRVLRAAAEMNYRPNVMARSLRTTVDRPIAVISDTLATEPYGGELLEGCLTAAAEHGRLITLGETRRDPDLESALIELFLAEQLGSFVFASVYPREIALPASVGTARVIMLNCAATDPTVAAVLPDERDGGRRAGEFLAAHGRTEGVWLIGDRAPHAYAPGRDREAGLAQVLELTGTVDCAWEPEAGYEAVRTLLPEGPRVLVCLNDRIAFGAYQALAEAGLRVPDDVAVLGFESSVLAEWLRPGLTSVDRPLRAMGRRAVKRLLGPEPPTGQERLAMAVRERGSV